MINTTSDISSTRKVVVTAMLAAISVILMFIDFSVPFMPMFIKMDISEVPALIASFSMGPISGTFVCLIKNVINIMRTTTGGVGEFANFVHGICFVVPAGIIYSKMKSKKGAFIGCVVGAFIMGVTSVPINYFVTYPIYSKLMPIDAIVGMYQAIVPSVNGLLECLIVFNMPFTFLKGLLDAVLTMLVYKRIFHIIKGRN